ncbi:MAG: NlpC/P60 family protein [Eubacteriaceae bacterium]
MKNKFMKYIEKLSDLKDNKTVIICGFLSLVMITFLVYQNTFSYELYLNNEKIGIANEKYIVEEALVAVETLVKEEYGSKANYKFDISVEKVRVNKDQNINQKQLQENIYKNLDIYKPAAVIIIDGQESLILETEEQAESILETIKEPFIDKIQNENVEILEVSFVQDVEVSIRNVPVENIFSEEKAISQIEESKDQMQNFEIAIERTDLNVSRSNNTSIITLDEINQDNYMEELISKVVEKPYIDVSTIIKQTVIEEIDYKVEKEETSSLYKGDSKVKQEGIKGKKEVLKELKYVNGVVDEEKVIDEEIITEPTKKIVLVGTKSRPVSISSNTVAPTYNGDLGSSIVATAKHYIGIPYVRGGSSPSGFDCSGFTQYVFKQYGINLPRTSGGQGSAGGYVSRSDLKPGDLVIFSGHVGIYVGGSRFIHSPSTGGRVEITSLNTAYWRSKYISGRRVY